MLTQILLVSLLGMQIGAPGLAWDVSYFHHDAAAPQVFGPTAMQERACAREGSVCFLPGGSATLQSTKLGPGGSALTVLSRDAKAVKQLAEPALTREIRAEKHAAELGVPYGISLDQPWQIDMVANFKSRSTNAPIEVEVQDADIPPSMAKLFARVVWNVDMTPAKHLGMRVALLPDEGFDPLHSYRVRVVQHQGKTRKVLAEGEFRLG